MIHHKKSLTALLVLLLVALATFVFWPRKEGKAEAEPQPDTTTVRAASVPFLVNEICRTSRLYTSEYQIHKIVTHTDAPTLEGNILGIPVKVNTRWGDRKVAIPITVTLKAYIDFSTFRAEQVKRTPDGRITLILPDPVIVATSSRVDHQGTRQYIDATRSRYSDAEIAEFARQGADSIMSHSLQLSIVAQAERSAAMTLLPVLRRLGYKDEQITISFRKEVEDSPTLQITKPS